MTILFKVEEDEYGWKITMPEMSLFDYCEAIDYSSLTKSHILF